jgi:hypothetical protein
VANARLKPIGHILELSLDTAERSAGMRIALRGEAEPVELIVKRYALDSDETRDALTLVDVTSSREWLAGTLQQFVVGRPFPIPHRAARALRLLT